MADGLNTIDTDALRLSPHLPDSRRVREQEDAVLMKGSAAFNGDKRLQAIYQRAKELILHYDLFLFKQTVRAGEEIHLIICNTWRVEKSLSGNITLSERDYQTGEWYRVSEEALPDWPFFLLWPIVKGQPKFWRVIGRKVIDRALNAAARIEGMHGDEWIHGPGELDLIAPLEVHYLGQVDQKSITSPNSNTWKWSNGVLHPGSMFQAARALRAAFFEHIVDKELFSVALAIDYQKVGVDRYLKLAMHCDAVLRVARERRNLVPLLPCIDSKRWCRDDLFSHKWWVRSGRKSTIIDRSSKQLKSFDTAAQWRWISRAPISVVSAWSRADEPSVEVISVLAEANIAAKIPVAATRAYVGNVYSVFSRLNCRAAILKLARIYLLHSCRLWKKSGYEAVRIWLRAVQLEAVSIRDYLAHEGLAKKVLQKNSTWPSLLELSEDWHQRKRLAAMKQEEDRCRGIRWESTIAECEIDGFTFTPLTSAWALSNEAYEMDHCVDDYVLWCLDGVSRIFAVRGKTSQRATLELRIDQTGCPVAQLQGAFNVPGGIDDYPSMKRAAENLALRYAAALQGKRGRRVGKSMTGG